MVASGRSVAGGLETGWGQSVWTALCRVALRGIDWAAESCGVKDTTSPMERSELLVGYGAPELPAVQQSPIDWAKLDSFERGRVAREARGATTS